MKYIKNLNHSRVSIYTVTHNEKYRNFLISPDYLYEQKLKFVYERYGKHIEKIIDVAQIGKYLKYFKIFKRDDETLSWEYRGEVYEIKEDVIFNM